MEHPESIKANEYAALTRSEYLVVFDTFCEQLRKVIVSLSAQEKIEDIVLSAEVVTDYRKKAMVLSYYKYGQVLENYVRHKLMNPLGDIAIRVDKYRQTHALDYVVDICNFAMLAYWSRTNSVHIMQEPDVFAIMYLEDLKSSYLDIILAYTEEYIKTKDLTYLAMICLRSYAEAANPSFSDSEYKKTDDENIKISGFSVNEMKKFAENGKKG